MILPYSLRLLCLCLASFFVVNATSALLLRFFCKSALQLAERKSAGFASRLLLTLRLLPFVLAAVFVRGCYPIQNLFGRWREHRVTGSGIRAQILR